MNMQGSAKIKESLGVEEYIRLTEGLIKKLDRSKFNSVLGVGRGGAMLGIILSHTFSRPFRHLHIQYMDVEKGLLELGPLPYTLSPVLVVDDKCDTGKTLSGVTGYLRNKKVLTAVLFLTPWSEFKPDYFEVKTEAWIDFWYETMGGKKPKSWDGRIISKRRKG